MTEQAGKMAAIKDQIERGQYRVDSGAVADAILRRLGHGRALPDGPRAYNVCSYPDNSVSESPKRTPRSP